MAYRNHRNTASRPSIYQTVTDRIIRSLRAGMIPWEKPWKTPRYAGGPFPRNFYTGKPYRGINVLLLWSSEYSSPFWLTFKQAQALKGTVRKGEHGTQIIFYKQLSEYAKNDDEAAGEHERVPFVLCHYTVFNVEQCDGLTLPDISQPAIAPEIDKDELCESIVTGWESRRALHLNSPTEYHAYYRSATDSVHMPARSEQLQGVVAIDGKVLRRSFDRASDKSALHMVSAWGCRQRLVLAQIATDAKSNEITAVPKLLKMLAMEGAIVTTDALNCQRTIAAQIVEQKGDYALPLKGNQGTLHDDVVLLDDPELRASNSAPVVEADHGGIETRAATVSTEIG